jgi:hypothetical protein
MREFVRDFCRIAEETFDLQAPVVELGSYQVAGQEGLADLRPIFGAKQYIGCDMRPGIGVDRVENLPRLSFADGSIPTIVCLDTLEHVFEVSGSIAEIHRVLSDGGVFVVSSVFNFPIHSHPYDYWRFTPECLARLLSMFSCQFVASQGSEDAPHTVYGLGFKGPTAAEMGPRLGRFEVALRGVMLQHFRNDVGTFIGKRIARRGRARIACAYPYYWWRRRRYACDRELFYRLTAQSK